MTDPYKPRRDWNRVGLTGITVLMVLLLGLLGIYVFGRGQSDDDRRSEAALQRQMDQAEAASETVQKKRRAEEMREMQ